MAAQERVRLEKELADIPGERAAADKEQRLTSEMAGLEQQLVYLRLDVTGTVDKLGKVAADMQVLTQVRCQTGHQDAIGLMHRGCFDAGGPLRAAPVIDVMYFNVNMNQQRRRTAV